jgi:hypothetical protein
MASYFTVVAGEYLSVVFRHCDPTSMVHPEPPHPRGLGHDQVPEVDLTFAVSWRERITGE